MLIYLFNVPNLTAASNHQFECSFYIDGNIIVCTATGKDELHYYTLVNIFSHLHDVGNYTKNVQINFLFL